MLFHWSSWQTIVWFCNESKIFEKHSISAFKGTWVYVWSISQEHKTKFWKTGLTKFWDRGQYKTWWRLFRVKLVEYLLLNVKNDSSMTMPGKLPKSRSAIIGGFLLSLQKCLSIQTLMVSSNGIFLNNESTFSWLAILCISWGTLDKFLLQSEMKQWQYIR